MSESKFLNDIYDDRDKPIGLSSRRRKPTVETCVDNTAKLRPQASVLAR